VLPKKKKNREKKRRRRSRQNLENVSSGRPKENHGKAPWKTNWNRINTRKKDFLDSHHHSTFVFSPSFKLSTRNFAPCHTKFYCTTPLVRTYQHLNYVLRNTQKFSKSLQKKMAQHSRTQMKKKQRSEPAK